MKYEKLNNYVKIEKFSETIKKISLTNKQRKLILQLVLEIGEANTKLKLNFNLDNRILLMPLLLLEGEKSSLIEGTKSMFEDFSYDLIEMNNIPQWETRNLIELYDKYILDPYYSSTFTFSNGSLSNMHIDLFKVATNSKFKMVFDTSARIKQVNPGKIISDNSRPNFIGNNNEISEANLILLKPSLKAKYLNDLTSTLEKLHNNDELLVDHIIYSHPIFEAIHPFSDGNGRLGRLLISLLFKKIFNLDIPIYISEEFNLRKKEYKANLLNVQLKNDCEAWNSWTSFFIACLISLKKKLNKRLMKLIDLFNNKKETQAYSTPIRKEITNAFFKYYLVNKKITIKHLQNKFPKISIQTLYKDFDAVVLNLNCSKKNDGYYAFDDLLAIIRQK